MWKYVCICQSYHKNESGLLFETRVSYVHYFNWMAFVRLNKRYVILRYVMLCYVMWVLCCQVLLLNHISDNLRLSTRIQLLTAFVPVAHQLSRISIKLPELFSMVKTSHFYALKYWFVFQCAWIPMISFSHFLYLYKICHLSLLFTSNKVIEGLRERTEHLDIYFFFRPSLNNVLFPMFCLLVEGECQI